MCLICAALVFHRRNGIKIRVLGFHSLLRYQFFAKCNLQSFKTWRTFMAGTQSAVQLLQRRACFCLTETGFC